MTEFNFAKHISFHDSSLVRIVNIEGEIHLYVEDVYIEDVQHSMKVSLQNVKSILRIDITVDQLYMETEDGEIVRFHEENSEIIFAVIWNKYLPRSEQFCLYVFKGPDIIVEIHDSKPTE